jgi:hypothetical protein
MIRSEEMEVEAKAPNLLLRVLWFVLIGWWLTGILSTVAWFLNATIIGLPLGLLLINRLPTFATLRPQDQSWRIEGAAGDDRPEHDRQVILPGRLAAPRRCGPGCPRRRIARLRFPFRCVPLEQDGIPVEM